MEEVNALEEHAFPCGQGLDVFGPGLAKGDSFFWCWWRSLDAPAKATLITDNWDGVPGKGQCGAVRGAAVDTEADGLANLDFVMEGTVQTVF
jgi:hypothetical protein